jgi:hypothetical protein
MYSQFEMIHTAARVSGPGLPEVDIEMDLLFIR